MANDEQLKGVITDEIEAVLQPGDDGKFSIDKAGENNLLAAMETLRDREQFLEGLQELMLLCVSLQDHPQVLPAVFTVMARAMEGRDDLSSDDPLVGMVKEIVQPAPTDGLAAPTGGIGIRKKP